LEGVNFKWEKGVSFKWELISFLDRNYEG